MTHPTREQWMSFLHDETNGAEGRALQQHLGDCAECRAQVSAWQETRRRLDTWKVAPPRPRTTIQVAWTRWAVSAAAAVAVLVAGFALGRAAGPSRAELASLQAEVQELKSGVSVGLDPSASAVDRSRMLEFANDVNARIAALQAQQALLRRELETVAVNTQAGFNRTENQLVELASASQPEAKQ